MLTKEFFTDALTSTQKSEIDTCIAEENSFIV